MTVIEDSGLRTKNGSKKYKCLCECGNYTIVSTANLKNKTTKSCGCYNRELKAERGRKQLYKDGLSNHPLYPTWSSMKARCYNKNNNRYKHYGGRGIKVCDRWKNSFKNFLEDMGEKPSKNHSLDRINVNGNYEPENCKWATGSEQAINKRQITQYKNIHKRKDRNRYIVTMKRNGYIRHKNTKTLQEAIKIRDTWLEEYKNNPNNW